ncbi:MAG: hypothetical protein ACHQ9S_23270 [Candidatus Binatia bacterium]
MRWSVFLLALLLSLGAVRAAPAQTASLSELAKHADLIALGRCQSAESAWDDAHRLIVTTIHFQPTRSFKGTTADRLTVKVLGGQVGHTAMTASHGAAMAAGEEAVLFLRRSRFGSYFVVWGGAGGKLPVRVEPFSGRRMIGGALAAEEFAHLIDATAGQ